jgi:HAD superfamily hydrolase (TIGR01509 family)
MTVRAIIWDLGGVILRTFDRAGRQRWEKQLGLAPNGLERLVFRSEVSLRASLGQARPGDVWRYVGESLSLTDREVQSLQSDFFGGDRVDQELMAFIRDLRPQYKTGLLSNAWAGTRRSLQTRFRIADAFDHIVISSEVGVLKPDPRIYQLSLRGLGISPAQAIFIDDFTENVEAARSLGLHAVLFQDPTQTIEEIEGLLAG